MKRTIWLFGSFVMYAAVGAAFAQANLFYNAGWTNNPNGLAACGATLE